MESHRSNRTLSSKNGHISSRKTAASKQPEDITAFINPITGAIGDTPYQPDQQTARTRESKAESKMPPAPSQSVKNLFPSAALNSKLFSPVLKRAEKKASGFTASRSSASSSKVASTTSKGPDSTKPIDQQSVKTIKSISVTHQATAVTPYL